MTQKAIGPNFANELAAYGAANSIAILGAHFSWLPDGTLEFFADTPSNVEAAVEAVYAAHDPTKPDPNAAAASLLAGGLALTSTGTPALNGTYAVDPASQQKITSEQLYIATTGKFTNGLTARAWLDAAGAAHSFPDTAHFTAFAEAAAQFVDAVATAQAAALAAGGAWAAPANTATIA